VTGAKLDLRFPSGQRINMISFINYSDNKI
jgi:hypothetical protein